jgi:hypothetical protein
MPKVWKIISSTKHIDGGPPLKEYFLVAISDQFAAMAALRKRRNLGDAELTVVGEATPEFVEWLDVQDGEILSVMAVSGPATAKS